MTSVLFESAFNIFYQIAAILLLVTIAGTITLALRQPLILAFITVGILINPAITQLNWMHLADKVDLFAKLGIALLLLIVGLKLDLHLIRAMGTASLAIGLGQALFISVTGYFIAISWDLAPAAALYIAIALMTSSTIIMVKLLSDKREIDSLHGRIALGYSIVQDLIAIFAMIGLTVFATEGQSNSIILDIAEIIVKGVSFLGLLVLLMRFLLPRLLHHIARSPELLTLFAIAWAVSLATLGEAVGFSKEIGAFLAGLSLASSPFREVIASRLVSLRDFFLLFFFIDLGATLDLSLLGYQIGPAVVLSLLVLIGNPLIAMIIMGVMGYRKRTSFLAGLTGAQISEFSLILAALGITLGHIDHETLGLVTLIGLVTITFSTYMILYSHPIFEKLAPWLNLFQRQAPYRERFGNVSATPKANVILFGLGRFGGALGLQLRAHGWRVLGVDFDPQAVETWRRQGLQVRYGDAEDPEYPNSLPLHQVSWIISTIPHTGINLNLLSTLKFNEYKGNIALAAHSVDDMNVLETAGADMILLPFTDAAEKVAERLAPWHKLRLLSLFRWRR